MQSGDLDTNTPIEQGRAAAAQFAHATFAVIANAGHTPDKTPCGAAMAADFVEHLRTDPNRCRRAGRPPVVSGRPARRAAELPSVGRGPAGRAVAVALATIADARSTAEALPLFGTVGALRGGAYTLAGDTVRFDAARVVTDAVADGTLDVGSGRARLRLHGRGVPSARLTVSSTRITGTVGGRRVALRVPRAGRPVA